ncbi:MAG: hypothetical protein GX350_04270 [Erysipelotrichaceae bacterium]|nr:hypothetical protein [Erysipelotrichaceae bacterium]
MLKVNVYGGMLKEEEKQAYVDYALTQEHEQTLKELDITLDGEYVTLAYHYDSVPFERIRRITGYLVGTTDRFNDGKKAEVDNRVKHVTSK